MAKPLLVSSSYISASLSSYSSASSVAQNPSSKIDKKRFKNTKLPIQIHEIKKTADTIL